MACNCIPNGTFKVSSVGPIDSIGTIGSVDSQTEMQRQHLEIISQTMCNWAEPTYGDAGETWEKTFWKAALIAVSLINTTAQISIMEKRYDIADDYAKLAEDRWNRFKNKYAPLERAMMSESGNAEEYEPDYPGAKDRASTDNTATFLLADDHIADLAKKYNLCVDPSLLEDMNYAEAISLDDNTNYNYRDEEFFALYKSDQRWNRRNQMLNLGRGIQATAASYADAANNALAELGGLADAGAQGAMKLLGYLSTARETVYPAQFSAATPLTGSASALGSSLSIGPSAMSS